MHRFPTNFTYSSQSSIPSSSRTSASPTPPLPPTDDAIEAIIQQATSARPSDTRPLRDTRTQLFVGNLPYRVRWQDLKDLFRKAGTVLRADVSLGPDNRSRGYGTVLLATAEDAGRAVDMFHGYSWQTRVLEVRLDRLLPEYEAPVLPLGSNPATAGISNFRSISSGSLHGPISSTSEEREYSSIYHGSDPNISKHLFVGNLPFHCQWQDLKDLFRQAGTVLRADVALGPDGRSRGYGTVVLATEYDAERAVRMFNGYEFSNRILKVHFDKPPHGGQIPPTSASPATMGSSTPAHAHSHPSHITLPPGFMLDYVPSSVPTSPYEMFSQLQHQQRQQQSHLLHHPQAHLYQKLATQQRQPHQQHSHTVNEQSSLDIEDLTNSLASSRVSVKPHSAQTSIHKPSPISTHTSSSSTTGSSSEYSTTSTSASSVSQSPGQAHSFQQQKEKQAQHHPHHPGPISLPPLRPQRFPVSPHTPQAHPLSSGTTNFISLGMGSPYQMYPTAHHAAYHPQSPATQLTPHGLPPITPSMPPFILLQNSVGQHTLQMQQQASMANQRQHRPHHQHHHYSSSVSGSSDSASGSGKSSVPATATPSAAGNNIQQQQVVQPQPFMIPLPSPGLYFSPPQPSPPVNMHINLAGIPSVLSPGVAMSPGTFYGRPGEVPNPNPFINTAVGAPVHAHAHSPGHGLPHPPHITHGAYFYAMSSPKRGASTGLEPKGYFDPMYFPAGGVHGIGGSALANEIMQDKSEEGRKKGKEKEKGTSQDAEKSIVDEVSPQGDASVGTTRTTTGTEMSGGSSATSLTSWNTFNEVSTSEEQDPKAPRDSSTIFSNDGVTISRTHSVGHPRKATLPESTLNPISLSRGNSDPIPGVKKVETENVSAAAAILQQRQEFKLPEQVPRIQRKTSASANRLSTAEDSAQAQ